MPSDLVGGIVGYDVGSCVGITDGKRVIIVGIEELFVGVKVGGIDGKLVGFTVGEFDGDVVGAFVDGNRYWLHKHPGGSPIIFFWI